MNNTQGALHFGAGINMAEWRNNIAEMRRDILGLSNTTQSQTKQMDSSFRMIGTGLATYFSGAALANFTNQIINIRGEFQKTEIAFGTMLKSTDKAKALMGQMVELAAKTPFSLQDVSTGAKQLLAFQVPAEQVVDTLTRMGNIAAGLGVPLGRINLVYGQVMAKGKLAGDDLRQFTEAGIPMLAELAKKFNTSTAEISKMVTAGKIGFKDVQDVLFSMTNEGGMFFNLMEKQSASLSGKMSNLEDAIDQMFNKMGQKSEGFLSDAIDSASYLVDNYEEVLSILGVLITTYGAYRAALMLVSASQAAAVAPTILTSFGTLINLIRGATSAQVAFNIAGMANPFVAIATVVVGLSTVIYAYRKELGELIGVVKEHTAAQKIQEQVMTTYNDKFGAGVIESQTQIQNLINIIKSEYSTLTQRQDAYNRLIAIDSTFRGTLDAQFKATWKLGDAFTHLITRMQKFAMAQAEMAVQAEKYKALAESQMELGITQVKYDDATKETKRLASLVNSGKLSVKEYAKAVRDLGTTDLANQLVKINKVVKENRNEVTIIGRGNVQQLSDLQKGLAIQSAQIRGGKINGRVLSSTELANLKAEYEVNKKIFDLKVGAEQEQSVIPEPIKPDEEKKKTKNKARELAEIYSLNSIADLEQRISLWNEALQKASGETVNELTKNKFGDTVKTGNIVTVAQAVAEQEKLEKAKAKRLKEISIQTFDEEVTELQRQFEVRDMLIEKGQSKTNVDLMFPKLKDENLIVKLKQMREELQELADAGTATEETANNLFNIIEVIDKMEGKESVLDKFTKSLDQGKIGRSSSEYLDWLREQKVILDDIAGSTTSMPKNNAINERIRAEKDAQKQFYQDFLKEKETFEQKKKDIDDKYNSIDSQINGSNNSADEKARLLTESGRARGKEYSEAFLSVFKDSDLWEKAFGEIANLTRKEINDLIPMMQIELKRMIDAGVDNSEIEAWKKKIEDFKRAGQGNSFSALTESVSGLFSKIKDGTATVEDFNRTINTMFSFLNDAKQITENVQDVFVSLGGTMDSTFGDVLTSIQDSIAGLEQFGEGAMKAIEGFAKGNILQGVAGSIKAIGGLVKSVGAWMTGDKKKEREIKKQQAALKELERTYNDLGRAINNALGDKFFDASKQGIENLKQQQNAINEMIRQEESKKKKNRDNDKIADWKQQLRDIDNTIAEIGQSISDKILNGLNAKGLAEQLSDAFVSAFRTGEDSAEAMGKTVDKILADMVNNALRMKLLEGPMKDVVNKMLSSMGYDSNGNGTFDGLTDQERQDIKNMITTSSQNYASALQEYKDLFGAVGDVNEGMKGDIKGITERTAGALESQINTMRIYQAESLAIHRNNQLTFLNSLNNLIAIEFNTRNLIQIRQDISEMNSKMKKGLAGIG